MNINEVSGEKDKQARDEGALGLARQRVYDVFDSLSIPYKVFDHQPIFSAADRMEKQVVVDGLICKNLFLRNKDKSRYYLYTLPIDKRADLLALQKVLSESRLSFGDAEALWEKLHITPGSVSLLNIIDAEEKPCSLKFLIDSETLEVPGIGLHPNDNAATIVFAADAISGLLKHYGAEFEFVIIS